MIPLNLTVPAHLRCSHTPDVLLAVTTGHNLSQAVTTRWNQSWSVISFWWHKDGSALRVWEFCLQTWLDVSSTYMMWGVPQIKNPDVTKWGKWGKLFWLYMERLLCSSFISGFHAIISARFFLHCANIYQPVNRPIQYLWKIRYCHPLYLSSGEFCEVSLDIITDYTFQCLEVLQPL